MNKSEKPLDRPLSNKITDPATQKCITDDTIPHLLVCWLTRTIVLSLMLWAGSNCSKIWCQGLSGLILFSTNIHLIFSVTILRVSDTDIIHQVSSVTLNISTNVTLQNNPLQSIEPFTIHVSENHICSHSLDWIQMSVIHCNIGSVNTPFHLCRRFRGSSVFKCNVCLYVCWSGCFII